MSSPLGNFGNKDGVNAFLAKVARNQSTHSTPKRYDSDSNWEDTDADTAIPWSAGPSIANSTRGSDSPLRQSSDSPLKTPPRRPLDYDSNGPVIPSPSPPNSGRSNAFAKSAHQFILSSPDKKSNRVNL
jgi:hypothetical protein